MVTASVIVATERDAPAAPTRDSMDAKLRAVGRALAGWGLVLSPHDLVMRTMSYIYHLGCFQCVMCGQSLQVSMSIISITSVQNTFCLSHREDLKHLHN